MKYTAEINNTCNRDVNKIQVKLVQYTSIQGASRELIVKTYHAKKSIHDVAKQEIDKEIPGKTNAAVVTDQPFVIPSVCPTLGGVCQIISVTYALVFTFGVRASGDKDLIIPITIGTMPLRSSDDAYLPPPTYSQTMYENDGEKEEFKDDEPPAKGDVYESDATSFKPLYPNFIGFNF